MSVSKNKNFPYLDKRGDDNNPEPSCNIVVHNIEKSVSENELYDLFGSSSGMKRCKLNVSGTTGQSLGYGFLEYASVNQAEQAIQQFNGYSLSGRTLRLSFGKGTKPEDGSANENNVYIAGLPESMDDMKLRNMFESFGKISSSKAMMNRDTSTCKGIGFVKYVDAASAKEAIAKMNGKKLEDSLLPLTVKVAMPLMSKEEKQRIMDEKVAEERLKFETPGNPYSPMGYQRMLTPLIAAQTQVACPVTVKGIQVFPASGHNSVVTGEVSSLYIHGLPLTCNEQTLYELFSPFGAVLNVKPIYDNKKDDSPCKGFGFVNFHKYEDALHAVTAMHGYEFHGRPLHVSFKEEKPDGPPGRMKGPGQPFNNAAPPSIRQTSIYNNAHPNARMDNMNMRPGDNFRPMDNMNMRSMDNSRMMDMN